MLRSCSGVKHPSSSASTRKPTMIKSRGWNCPYCRMGSPRHWNVARHILRLHQGLGEPVNEFGKTKEQSQFDMNLQFSHNHQNTQKLVAFRHDQFKESGSSATRNYRMDNNNKRWWDYIDGILEPVKKFLEFHKVFTELSMLNPQTSYHYPSAISYQYPSHLSTPISFSSVGSMNIGNNSSNRILTNESNKKGISEVGEAGRELRAWTAKWLESRSRSSQSAHWWEQNTT